MQAGHAPAWLRCQERLRYGSTGAYAWLGVRKALERLNAR
ncbi:hypothetical protein ABIE76_002673 [Sinorhizobium fredii]